VQRPALTVWEYARTAFAIENGGIFADLRRSLSFIDPTCYRGVSRAPVDASELRRICTASVPGIPPGLIGEEDVIDTLELASFLFGYISGGDMYELIYVEMGEFTQRHETVGYDLATGVGIISRLSRTLPRCRDGILRLPKIFPCSRTSCDS
jgi:hypothetical protein